MKNFKLLSKRMHIHEQVEVIMKNQDDPLSSPPVLWIKENLRRIIFTFYADIFPKAFTLSKTVNIPSVLLISQNEKKA